MEYLVQQGSLTAVADAIRKKGGTTAQLQFPKGFVAAVEAIETGGGSENNLLGQYISGQLTEVVDDSVTAMGQSNLFYRCETLTRVELPNAVGNCPEYAFYYTTALETCLLPKITRLKNSCFLGSGLVTATFPAVKTLEASVFRECSQLERLDLPVAQSILGYYNFLDCTSLNTLILRKNTVVLLASEDALEGTPMANGTGYIYVPRAQLSEYQADSVWGLYASQFRAIEDYPNI